MGFVEDRPVLGPLGLNPALAQDPEEMSVSGMDVLGAAARTQSPFFQDWGPDLTDPNRDYDPEYRAWDDIVGTEYEQFSDAFVGSRTRQDVDAIKSRIDQEVADRQTLDAAGGWGIVAEMGASLLSPSTLLPGGALVKGVKGFSIAKTAGTVGLAAGGAAVFDELVLHSAQETRTGTESAFNIGGSVVLGGILGGAAGTLSQAAFNKIARQIDDVPEMVSDFHGSISSAGARDIREAADLTLRNERVFQIMSKTGVLRPLVRSDPLLRAQLSDLTEVRHAIANLAETPLQYHVNEDGVAVVPGGSAEQVIKSRRNTTVSEVLGEFSSAYSKYWYDGSVGSVGTITAPISARTSRLLNRTEKLTRTEFSREVGRALMSGDTHPIPQIDSLAKQIRAKIFDPIKDEGIEVGLWTKEQADAMPASYFMRIYNKEKITRDLPQFKAMLEEQFKANQARAQTRLAEDSTLMEIQNDIARNQEDIRQSMVAFRRAQKKARDKAGRAEAAVARQNAIGRVTDALRRSQGERASNLEGKTITPEERKAFREMVSAARRSLRNEPPDILKAIRNGGGLRKAKRANQSGLLGNQRVDTGIDQDLVQALDGVKNIFRNAGQDADEMLSRMIEDGYLPEGTDLNGFYDALRRAASGERIYSRQEFRAEIDAFESASAFSQALDEAGLNIKDVTIEDLIGRPIARSQKTTKAKAREARRGEAAAARKSDAAKDGSENAVARLEAAQARLEELDDVVKPKVRAEIRAAREEISRLKPLLKKAQQQVDQDEALANMDDLEIKESVSNTVKSILGLKGKEHSYQIGLSSPTKARVLDIDDQILEPWLETDARTVVDIYTSSIIPDLEITKRFGDVQMTDALQRIDDEVEQQILQAKTEKTRTRIKREGEIRKAELEAVRDRIRGLYGVPEDPNGFWTRSNRVTRTLSYMGLLGGIVISAVPDLASVIGRSGMEAAYGATNVRRLFDAARGVNRELGGAAEWYLNSRAVAISEILDPNSSVTGFERGLAQAGSAYGYVTGMTPWNTAWKSIGGAMVSSRLLKAAKAVRAGTATKAQKVALAENNIVPSDAVRIADQFDKYGDADGSLWMAQAAKWDDDIAFEAFRNAMTREMDISIITPGQDKPLLMSREGWKFLTQFRSFAFAANHRILLSGIQRADATVLAQFSIALMLGGVVSITKAKLSGYDQKEGSAFWVDALDRSGLGGWLFEVDAAAQAMSSGRFGTSAITGERLSRFQSRSGALGLAGPNVDFVLNMQQASASAARGELRQSDVNRLFSHVPGQNHPIARILGITRAIRESVGGAVGAQ